jgi:hypothetical protein
MAETATRQDERAPERIERAPVSNALEFAVDSYTTPPTKQELLTQSILRDFCGKYFNQRIADTAALVRHFDNPDTRESSFALYAHEHADEPKLVEQIACDLMSRLRIEEHWEDQLTRHHTKKNLHFGELDDYEDFDFNDDSGYVDDFIDDDSRCFLPGPDEIPRWWAERQDLWQFHPPMSGDLDTLRDKVTIESIMHKAAEMLAKFHLDEDRGCELQVYRDVYAIRSFYAPLCELAGFDGMAMALRSEADIRQLIATGNEQYIEQARAILEGAGDGEEAAQFMEEFLTDIAGDNLHEAVLGNEATHGITIGEGLCHDDTLRVNWRLKSLGSLAMKLKRRDGKPKKRENEQPMDLFAGTIITRDAEQLARVYASIIRNVERSERATPTPSPSRDTPFHIRGTKQFIDTIAHELGIVPGMEGYEQAYKEFELKYDVRPTDGNYQVAKVTTMYKGSDGVELPVEIQLVTEESRRAYRKDEKEAHAAFKSNRTVGTHNGASYVNFSNKKRHFGGDGIPDGAHTPARVLVRRSKLWLSRQLNELSNYINTQTNGH